MCLRASSNLSPLRLNTSPSAVQSSAPTNIRKIRRNVHLPSSPAELPIPNDSRQCRRRNQRIALRQPTSHPSLLQLGPLVIPISHQREPAHEPQMPLTPRVRSEVPALLVHIPPSTVICPHPLSQSLLQLRRPLLLCCPLHFHAVRLGLILEYWLDHAQC